MIPLFDDFTHIGFACTRWSQQPQDRPLINGLNCLLGESIENTRWVSLFCVLLSLWILDRLAHRERDSRRFWVMGVQPLLWMPFFWASQITTSLTVLWAAVWTAVALPALELRSKFFKPNSLLLFIAVTGLGAGVRLEAAAYAAVLLGLTWILRHSWQEFRSKAGFILAGSTLLVGAVWLAHAGMQKILIPRSSAPIAMDISTIGKEAFEVASFYPSETYLFLQLDAVWRYFQALVWPRSLSFFGNWYRWWEIHQQPISTLYPWVGMVLLFSSIYLVFRRFRPQLGRWGMGIVGFVGVTALLSAIPRNDWYYPIRAYLGAICFWVGVAPLLVKNKWLWIAVVAVSGASTVDHLWNHWSGDSAFLRFEKQVTHADHPFLDLAEAKELEAKGQMEQAIQVLHGAYRKIPVESARTSTRAGTFWNLIMYEAWILYQKQGDAPGARMVYSILKESTYFPMVHACLQNQEVDPQTCLDPERRANFCSSLGFSYPKLRTIRPYQMDPETICGFKPQQK